MIVTSADQVRPHIQTVTTYAADFDEVQKIELDADDVDEWQYAYTNVAKTVYESQVKLPAMYGRRNLYCRHISLVITSSGVTFLKTKYRAIKGEILRLEHAVS